MITVTSSSNNIQPKWQEKFLQILPKIEAKLRYVFRRFDRQKRDELIQDGIVHCLLAYRQLFRKGRADSVSVGNLVWYAVAQISDGREAGCRLNSREPLSRYGQLRNQIQRVRLSSGNEDEAGWIDALVDDRRSPVLEQVAARLDLRAWLARLSRRKQLIAMDLAMGWSTSEVADKFGVSAGRVSQLRRELEASWANFQENGAATTFN